MRAVLIFACLALTACGADGPPERPEPREQTPGPGVDVAVTGSASFGVMSR